MENKNSKSDNIKKLCASAICLALALVLPFLTGQLQSLGNALCPMHVPVLLCGFICGWKWGGCVGLCAPLLRFLIFGMPPLFPIGAAMAVELLVYGILSGFIYKMLPKKLFCIYFALIASMIAGRLAWGTARFVIAGIGNTEFSLAAFWSGAITGALPGIAIQLILIPVLVVVFQKNGIILNSQESK